MKTQDVPSVFTINGITVARMFDAKAAGYRRLTFPYLRGTVEESWMCNACSQLGRIKHVLVQNKNGGFEIWRAP